VRLLPFVLPRLLWFLLLHPLPFGLPLRFPFVLPRLLLFVPRRRPFVLALPVPFARVVLFVRLRLLQLLLLFDSRRQLQARRS
jgi:hypothetical protein